MLQFHEDSFHFRMLPQDGSRGRVRVIGVTEVTGWPGSLQGGRDYVSPCRSPHCEATLGDVQLWVCGDNGDILSCSQSYFFLNQLINSTMALLQQWFMHSFEVFLHTMECPIIFLNCGSHEQEFN